MARHNEQSSGVEFWNQHRGETYPPFMLSKAYLSLQFSVKTLACACVYVLYGSCLRAFLRLVALLKLSLTM